MHRLVAKARVLSARQRMQTMTSGWGIPPLQAHVNSGFRRCSAAGALCNAHESWGGAHRRPATRQQLRTGWLAGCKHCQAARHARP